MARHLLDHASTSPIRPEALAAMVSWLSISGEGAAGDPGRIHAEGMRSRVALEQARSMAMFAAMTAASEDATERRALASAAKVQIGRSAKFIGQQGVQLHGGIGMTMEYKAGHYFKRLTMIENTFGDTDYHLRRVTDAGGLV